MTGLIKLNCAGVKEMNKETWEDLDYWRSGEWQVIQEHLDDLDIAGVKYNPARENLFAALDAVDLKDVKVAIYGQDPYPNPMHACGIAFSTGLGSKQIPPTLATIFREYGSDLHYPDPSSGDLLKWTAQGVLLWNVIPSCLSWKSLSHEGWTEWSYLTKEITEELDKRGVLFVMLGGRAQDYTKYVVDSTCIPLSHPSPRASKMARHPFLGSRMFTTINDKLVQQGVDPIDWKL